MFKNKLLKLKKQNYELIKQNHEIAKQATDAINDANTYKFEYEKAKDDNKELKDQLDVLKGKRILTTNDLVSIGGEIKFAFYWIMKDEDRYALKKMTNDFKDRHMRILDVNQQPVGTNGMSYVIKYMESEA